MEAGVAYLIPQDEVFFEQEIKRSRFIARIRHIESPQQAKQWLAEVHDEFPDARHVCWAYIAGPPNTTAQSMSDDGEPSGTAGKPMLNVLQHSGAGEIAAIVVRYFGGIKLGTGGLVRAYSSSVVEALKQAKLIAKIPLQELILRFAFAEEHNVRHLLSEFNGEVLKIQYDDQVQMSCHLPLNEVNHFLEKLPYSIEQVEP